jgi:hypothetical protein
MRKNKVYSYLDTVRGAGMKHYNKVKSGGGKGWSNWITVNNEYEKDMAGRVMDIARLGVVKDEAIAPIPDITDVMQLSQIDKYISELTNAMTSLMAKNNDVNTSAKIAKKSQKRDLAREYLKKPDSTDFEKIIKGGPNPVKSDIDVQYAFNTLRDYKAGGYISKIIEIWNNYVIYLNNIVKFDKLNQSDKNKINEKLDNILSIMANTVATVEESYKDGLFELHSGLYYLYIVYSRMITKTYKPITFIDYKDMGDLPENVKHLLIDTSTNIRKPAPNFLDLPIVVVNNIGDNIYKK